jgi:hypothetical protein
VSRLRRPRFGSTALAQTGAMQIRRRHANNVGTHPSGPVLGHSRFQYGYYQTQNRRRSVSGVGHAAHGGQHVGDAEKEFIRGLFFSRY